MLAVLNWGFLPFVEFAFNFCDCKSMSSHSNSMPEYHMLLETRPGAPSGASRPFLLTRRDFLGAGALGFGALVRPGSGPLASTRESSQKGYIDAHVHVWSADTNAYPSRPDGTDTAVVSNGSMIHERTPQRRVILYSEVQIVTTSKCRSRLLRALDQDTQLGIPHPRTRPPPPAPRLDPTLQHHPRPHRNLRRNPALHRLHLQGLRLDPRRNYPGTRALRHPQAVRQTQEGRLAPAPCQTLERIRNQKIQPPRHGSTERLRPTGRPNGFGERSPVMGIPLPTEQRVIPGVIG